MVRRTVVPMSLSRYLRARRRRAGLLTVFVLAVAACLIWADQNGMGLFDGDQMRRYDGRVFPVTRVLAGDTVEIDAPDGDAVATRVRLWGVEASGTVGGESLGRVAKQFTRLLVEGDSVRLTLEANRVRDGHGRLLAFVETRDGQMLNERLLVAGLARADESWNHRHRGRFAMLQMQARKDAVGIWAGRESQKRESGTQAPLSRPLKSGAGPGQYQ